MEREAPFKPQLVARQKSPVLGSKERGLIRKSISKSPTLGKNVIDESFPED